MYVAPEVRGRRIAEQVLAALVETGRALGQVRLVLETGVAQPEALRLYERLGWRPVQAYGHYRDSPLSRCYGLDLS
jgi:GNAT superfamily N-acetyltransferase